jgi:ribosomal protein L37E
MSDLLSVRKVKLYRYTCKDCGWVSYRDMKLEGAICSQCGFEGAPRIEEEYFGFSVSKWTEDSILKAKEYTERLEAGQDPLDIDRDLGGDVVFFDAPIFSLMGFSWTLGEMDRGLSTGKNKVVKY